MIKNESSNDTSRGLVRHFAEHLDGGGCGAVYLCDAVDTLVFDLRRELAEIKTAEADLKQELAAVAAVGPNDEIVEGAEYWILDPRLVIWPPVLACVQDLQAPGVVLFTIGSDQHMSPLLTRPRSTFNLRRQLAAVIRSRDETTEKDPRKPR